MDNSAPQAPSRILYVHHAAKWLHCTDRTVRSLIKRGQIPACRKGHRAWTIRLVDLIGFLARRRSSW